MHDKRLSESSPVQMRERCSELGQSNGALCGRASEDTTGHEFMGHQGEVVAVLEMAFEFVFQVDVFTLDADPRVKASGCAGFDRWGRPGGR